MFQPPTLKVKMRLSLNWLNDVPRHVDFCGDGSPGQSSMDLSLQRAVDCEKLVSRDLPAKPLRSRVQSHLVTPALARVIRNKLNTSHLEHAMEN